MSHFWTIHPPFTDFLEPLAQDASSPVHFQARNFLLDENVPEGRVRAYGQWGKAAAGFADEGAWTKGHRRYLLRRVFLGRPTNEPPRTLDPRSKYCPETFRQDDSFVTYGGVHSGLDLLRVLSLVSFAGRTGQDQKRLADAGREIVRARLENRAPDDGQKDFFDKVLRIWNDLCDLRPCFATFYADHEDILKDRPEDDVAGWADEFRDRLGLAHLAPDSALPEIPILVLRYSIGEVPKTRLRKLKPLAVPSVLDIDLNPAFCPAPPNPDAGHTVHLGQAGFLCREVVHPYMDFETKHLFRVGVVKKPVPSDLGPARWEHLRALRNELHRADYGAATDPEA